MKKFLWIWIVCLMIGIMSCNAPVKYTEKCDEQNDSTQVIATDSVSVDTLTIPHGATMP
jgi:hypothetical protein